MADIEVENTLREIRERVLAESRSLDAAGAQAAASPQGFGDSPPARGEESAEPLARMAANLSTTERAWSRLPPVLSYRRGAAARLELWLKRLVKRAAHWFTWEQVNFNSAAHHALTDARAALEAHAHALAQMRDELAALRAELTALRAELTRAETERAETESARAGELREHVSRIEHHHRLLSEELGVSFRQLSLEASELAVAHDRARRHLEARVGALEEKVKGD